MDLMVLIGLIQIQIKKNVDLLVRNNIDHQTLKIKIIDLVLQI